MTKQAYRIFRMGVAMDRIGTALTREEKSKSMRWAVAWGVASGAAVPANLKLRVRAAQTKTR